MQVVQVNINDLKPAEYNPRQMTKAQAKHLEESIKRFDLVEPIVVNNNPERMNVIIGGHQRYNICKKLGRETMPVVYVDLDETKEKELNLRLNKNLGEWNWDMLANFDEALLEDVGFDELENIFPTDEIKEDTPPEASSEPPKSKSGEVYQLGKHRLMCGDATKVEGVEKLMGGQRIKTIFTSPPYNMDSKMYKNYTDNLKSEEYIKFNLDTVNTWRAFLDGYMFWNISYNKNTRWEFLEIMYRIVKETGLKFLELIVWDKGHCMQIMSKEMLSRMYEDILFVGDENQIKRDFDLMYLGTVLDRAYLYKNKFTGSTNYWTVVPNKIQRDDHLAIFPVALPAKGIIMTTDDGDIVADPFGGSGSTLMACEQTGRICYMMELDEKYVDLIRRRYWKFVNSDNETGWEENTPVTT